MNEIKIQDIQIKDIVYDEFQPRQVIRTKELEDLSQDIKERGLLYPVLVMLKDGKYFLLDGERRTRACANIGMKTILARVLDVSELEAWEIQLVSNFKRAGVEIQETAKAVSRFKKEFLKKYPEKDPIARLVELTGFSRTYFEMADAINRAGGEFQEKIFSGAIGGYSAAEIEGATSGLSAREGLREGYVEALRLGKKISALAPRPLKNQLKDIEERNYNEEEKKQIAKGLLLKTYGLLNGESGKNLGNYLVYLEIIRQWQSDIVGWHLSGLKDKELKSLANELQNIIILFNDKRRSLFGKLESNPMYHLPK